MCKDTLIVGLNQVKDLYKHEIQELEDDIIVGRYETAKDELLLTEYKKHLNQIEVMQARLMLMF
jgi:hypothetical protein